MMGSPRRHLLPAGLLAPAWPALAQPEGRGGGQGQGQGQGRGQAGPPGQQGGQSRGPGQGGGGGHRGGGQRPSLGAEERATVQGWLQPNPGFSAQPPPPGMRNRLAQGRPLPPGIARRALPPDLLLRLPRHPGHDDALPGATLVLIESSTGLVAAILADAFLR